jgi:hypothetical protein
MWPEADPAFTEDEFRAWQRRRLPPDNESFAAVALNQLVVDDGDLVLWLSHAECYSTGVALYLEARTSRSVQGVLDAGSSVLAGVLPPLSGTEDGLRVELVMSDGVSVTNGYEQAPERPYLLSPRFQTAGASTASVSWWVSPLPAGRFSFVVHWAAVTGGGPAGSCAIDGDQLIRASERSRVLWPVN